MKISKLFHWLYASVMLLPLLAIGVTCLYTIFNKNAKDSYSGLNEEQSEFYYLESVNEIEIGKTYTWSNSSLMVYENVGTALTLYVSDFSRDGYTPSSEIDNIRFYSYTPAHMYINLRNGSTNVDYLDANVRSYTFTFKVTGIEYLNRNNANLFASYIGYTIYNNDTYLDNSFYYATRLLKESNYFNWAKDSFLAQPITYITSLFGMDNDNIVIYLLSYWLDISIIWLTFDLVMYVPLLVHRWLDKGVLE